MIETKNLTKTYEIRKRTKFLKYEKSQIHAVNGLSLSIPSNSITGLLGPNGAGKTTTISMLTTLLSPTSGTAMIGGYDVVREPQKVRQIINGVLGGERMLYWRLTGRENLDYFAELYGVPLNQKRLTINKLLELVGLTEAADMLVEQYSQGMKQRLRFARGLINNPQYLFLDEPTLGLDVAIAKEIRTYIKNLQAESKMTILLASHYMHEVEELCDYAYVISKGHIVACGTVEDIRRAAHQSDSCRLVIPNDSYAVMGDLLNHIKNDLPVQVMPPLPTAEGWQIDFLLEKKLIPQVLNTVIGAGLNISKMEIIEPSLEEAVIHLTAK